MIIFLRTYDFYSPFCDLFFLRVSFYLPRNACNTSKRDFDEGILLPKLCSIQGIFEKSTLFDISRLTNRRVSENMPLESKLLAGLFSGNVCDWFRTIHDTTLPSVREDRRDWYPKMASDSKSRIRCLDDTWQGLEPTGGLTSRCHEEWRVYAVEI